MQVRYIGTCILSILSLFAFSNKECSITRISYDIFKNHLNSYSDGSSSPSEEGGGGGSFAVHFASGMLAESVACIIYVPVDVIKERMQVQTTRQGNYYRSGMDALRQIAKQEGLSGIYKGYGATLLSFGKNYVQLLSKKCCRLFSF